MFPQMPEDLSAVNDLTELKRLRGELAAWVKAALADRTPETDAKLGEATEALTAVRARFETVKAEVARDEAAAQAAADAEADDAADAVAGPETDDDEEDETVEEDDDEEVVVDEAEEKVLVAAAGVRTPAKPKPSGKQAPAPKPASGKKIDAYALQAYSGVSGKQPGEAFGSWTELAEAVWEKAQSVSPSAADRHVVGVVKGGYEEAGRQLNDTPTFNLARFEQDELTAALCAPFTPYYNLGCANSARRPVFGSLPQFAAPRGGVSIYPSPSLSDITDGVGVWTAADDANPTARKVDCQTIECATPVDYVMYAVYRCLTVKNMLQMTFPELLEAYLNRLAAAWARMAEIRLLNLMATAASTITANTMAVGATESITSAVLRMTMGHQERQRWDAGPVRVWMHRWVREAIKQDLILHRRTDGPKTMPTDADVDRLFSNVNAQVTWTLDQASWMTAPNAQATADGNLVTWPTQIEMLMAPAGKFALIDRGELRVGVSGNNIYRDTEQLMRNEFTFFFESFEGIVDTDSCPADILEVPVCFNGVQVADVEVDCDLEAAA